MPVSKNRTLKATYVKKKTNLKEATEMKTKPKTERAEFLAFLNSLYAAG